jgi:hypothetical protein
MARQLQRDVDSFYSLFTRCTASPEAVTRYFIDDFYKIFQAELDAIKGKEEGRDLSKESLPKGIEDLINGLLRAIENNTVLVLTNQKLVEAQLELLARLKI